MWKEGMKERKEGGSVKQKGEKSEHDTIQVYICMYIYIYCRWRMRMWKEGKKERREVVREVKI